MPVAVATVATRLCSHARLCECKAPPSHTYPSPFYTTARSFMLPLAALTKPPTCVVVVVIALPAALPLLLPFPLPLPAPIPPYPAPWLRHVIHTQSVRLQAKMASTCTLRFDSPSLRCHCNCSLLLATGRGVPLIEATNCSSSRHTYPPYPMLLSSLHSDQTLNILVSFLGCCRSRARRRQGGGG